MARRTSLVERVLAGVVVVGLGSGLAVGFSRGPDPVHTWLIAGGFLLAGGLMFTVVYAVRHMQGNPGSVPYGVRVDPETVNRQARDGGYAPPFDAAGNRIRYPVVWSRLPTFVPALRERARRTRERRA